MQKQDERKTVEGFLAPQSPEVRDLMMRARALIMSAMPHAVEVVRPGRNAITYATGDKMAEWLIYIAPFKSRINIGFLRGTELPDPRRLMEGTGKLLRHVKIKSVEDLESPALRDLIEAAVATTGTAS